jgi:creatinine amidohydrolase/Fe(II)-dependent formamide hydrolase-like protein
MRVGKALARDGFSVIVAVSGHLGLSHMLAMETAARKVSRRYGVKMIAPVASVWRKTVQSQELKAACAALSEPITGLALEALLRGHHGGALETSLMLHAHPELVHPKFRTLARVRIREFVRWRSWTRERWPGYVGDPAMARADFGRLLLMTVATLGADLVARVMAGDALTRGEVTPLTSWLGRLTLRAALVLGTVGLAGGLAGFCLRVWRQGRRTRGDSA